MFGHEHHQRVLTSKEIKVRRKAANIAGLQLADLIAYPVKQACLLERGLIADPGDVFGKEVVKAVESKFNAHGRLWKVQGYGKVWL